MHILNLTMSNFILLYTWILHGMWTAGAKDLWEIYRKLNTENIPLIYIFPVNLEKITVIHF